MVLNMGSLDWESSALTTRPLLHISTESSKFVSCRARNVRRVGFKERFTINKIRKKASNTCKAKFRVLCGSKLSGFNPFDNMAIIHWVKNRLKTER